MRVCCKLIKAWRGRRAARVTAAAFAWLMVCAPWAGGGRTVEAAVRLPAVFGSHMVLQRDRPVVVWGWADAGERIIVQLGPHTKHGQADALGAWRVELPAMPAGGPHRMSVAGQNEVVFDDVMLGEVWVCSGQSNMAWPLSRALNPEKEVKEANHPGLRLFTAPQASQPQPQTQGAGSWAVCTPSSAAGFSAVAYFHGRRLHEELKVPVGLINTSWGGTRIEAWTPLEAMRQRDELKPLLDHWEAAVKTFDRELARAHHERQLAEWKVKAEEAKASKKPAPKRPDPPQDPALDRGRPGNLYNGMVHPLAPLPARGFIWYQGEANVTRAYQYRTLLPVLIESWRRAWGSPDMPFLIVQLAPFGYAKKREGLSASWCAELWEAQLLTAKRLPHTGLVVTTDVGDLDDIHPRNKQAVGWRLAQWALATTYGRSELTPGGPMFSRCELRGDHAVIHFDHARGLTSRDGKELTHFEAAGEDRTFHPAEARIEGATVVVRCPRVARPAAVRFAWDELASPNLVNDAGLPASAFRTDDWPAGTRDRHLP
jgi:sialate O-acetylesterase